MRLLCGLWTGRGTDLCHTVLLLLWAPSEQQAAVTVASLLWLPYHIANSGSVIHEVHTVTVTFHIRIRIGKPARSPMSANHVLVCMIPRTIRF